jgi:hypothetical protein
MGIPGGKPGFPHEAPYKLSGVDAKLASITFLSLAFSYWIDIPWFLTEGKLVVVLIIPSLGVPTGRLFTSSTPCHQSFFWNIFLLSKELLVLL